jgi:nucleotide-binding universal stress UspA family protein
VVDKVEADGRLREPEVTEHGLKSGAIGFRDALIVVGTYDEGPFRSAILGSTPHKLLHISETPVLCVPARGRVS